MKATLITGASSGIGQAMASTLATQGENLVITGTRKEKLEAIAEDYRSQYGIQVLPLSVDLSTADGAEKLIGLIEVQNIQIHRLINNAGFAYYSGSISQTHQQVEQLINLNVTSLVKLCNHYGSIMQKGDEILNVASTAAFQPIPGQNLYAASKAMVLSFSEGLNYELRDRGIWVSCLNPGVTDTNFFDRAGLKEAKGIFSLNKRMSPLKVAHFGFKLLRKRKLSGSPGIQNKINTFLHRLFSRRIVLALAAKIATY